MFIVEVNAYTYSEWSTVKPEISEELIEEENRCMWYTEGERINEEYLKKEDFNDKLYDLNDYYYTEWSEYSSEVPNEYIDREITRKSKKITFSDDNVEDIFIWNFLSDDLIVSEIDVYDTNTEKIVDIKQYDSYIEKYDTSFVTDGDYDTYYSLKDKRVMFDLDGSNKASNFGIKIYYKKLSDEENKIYHWYTKQMDYGIYMKTVSVSNKCENGCVLDLKLDGTYTNKMFFMISVYRYRDKLFKTYEIEKNYLDGYYASVDGYIKDEKKCIKYYRYITSSKVFFDDKDMVVNEEFCTENDCTSRIYNENYEEIVKEANVDEVIVEKEITNEENPFTIDRIYLYIGLLIVSLILLTVVIYFKKNVKLCNMK